MLTEEGGSQATPRNCIIASREPFVVLLLQIGTREMTAVNLEVKIHNSYVRMVVVCCYLPYESAQLAPSEVMCKMMEFASEEDMPLIISCNYRHRNNYRPWNGKLRMRVNFCRCGLERNYWLHWDPGFIKDCKVTSVLIMSDNRIITFSTSYTIRAAGTRRVLW